MMNTIDDKAIVKDYFNAIGFDRWRRIYGDGEVNKVQKDIRRGHQQTIDTVVDWLKAEENISSLSICDAGCGVGSLSIPLARTGARILASDISPKMVEEATIRAQKSLKDTSNVIFAVQDLEGLSGQYQIVICIDVLIHYPTEDAAKMIAHLASLATSRLILSFAPKNLCLTILKKIGEFFPGPSKTTRAYQHREKDVIAILENNGLRVQREAMTSTHFYYSRILETTRS
ncbi:magnesium protoporphyrin IX methyltransferase [cyanobacterium endosymbiont of Epithemia clementina EcSB]|uniref:magnesium protoporphyrin IX methyltransferase n=1 Tax=cyanobacterium endosymbiont of Epithemia clementina EcSB TaxID=3034674 RepID=UPI002480F020|nr:magnesium protoporphyrin IX methyltransferase [cyanobacterium endosymbiont of Epithemia clementina EcSB]WGT68501.1 magnesium protoporphyrin IX methyltransferase [cyanobacterium endosymbiont of Epithemia clementina EcSB]